MSAAWDRSISLLGGRTWVRRMRSNLALRWEATAIAKEEDNLLNILPWTFSSPVLSASLRRELRATVAKNLPKVSPQAPKGSNAAGTKWSCGSIRCEYFRTFSASPLLAVVRGIRAARWIKDGQQGFRMVTSSRVLMPSR